jgi:hypothetical protein
VLDLSPNRHRITINMDRHYAGQTIKVRPSGRPGTEYSAGSYGKVTLNSRGDAVLRIDISLVRAPWRKVLPKERQWVTVTRGRQALATVRLR